MAVVANQNYLITYFKNQLLVFENLKKTADISNLKNKMFINIYTSTVNLVDYTFFCRTTRIECVKERYTYYSISCWRNRMNFMAIIANLS